MDHMTAQIAMAGVERLLTKLPSLRDRFAGDALTGLMRDIVDPADYADLIAGQAYHIADAMLRAREK